MVYLFTFLCKKIHLIQKRLICSNSEYHDRNKLWDVMNLEKKQFAEK